MRSLAQILIDYDVHVYDIISNLAIEVYQIGNKRVHVGTKKVCTSTNFLVRIDPTVQLLILLRNKAPDCYFLRFSAGDELRYPLNERICKGASSDR